MFDDCTITFGTNPNYAFDIANTIKGTKLSLRDTVITSVGEIPYIIKAGNYSDYEIEIYNSKFTKFKNLMYCSSQGSSGGTIKLFNNVMTNRNIYNENNFVIEDVIPTKVSELINDKSYLTSIPSEYVTDSELTSKGYLTEHQDITGKADKSSAEIWTFILSDGSTVTKRVVLA
mgnify:CR=1 FL=1